MELHSLEEIKLPRGKGFFIKDFIYTKIRESSTKTYLRCVTKTCKAKANITKQNNLAVVTCDYHSHSPPNLQKIKFVATIKEAAKKPENHGVSVTRIYKKVKEEVLETARETVATPDHEEELLSSIPSFNSVRTIAYKARASSTDTGRSSSHSARASNLLPNIIRERSKPDVNKKREGYIEWDDYFMSVAFLSAQRSKDPSSQVGACIVNEEKKIVGIGYNGMPNGCSDNSLPWRKESDDPLETKYPYVCHAEMNAIMNKNSADVKNCTVYVALFPCNNCAKLIIQSGIKKILYFSDKHHDKMETKASKRMLNLAKVEYKQYIPSKRKVVIDFSVIDQTVFGAS